MINLTKTPVVGNYKTFEDAKFDYSNEELIPVFELHIENIPTDDYIKNEIDWDSKESSNTNSKRIPIFELDNETKKKLEPLLEQFNQDSIMNMLDELSILNPNMFYYWGYDKSKPPSKFFSRILEINTFIAKDKPTNYFSPHFDGRNTFGTIIVNLVDNQFGTQFFDYGDVSNVIKQKVDMSLIDWNHKFDNLIKYEAPKEKGKGIFFVNCETTLHGVGVGAKSDRDRYALFIMLNLKLK